ncbi:phosphohexomutase domain-containing protein [Desulfopila aestuarii]|uniref:phosphoglucomutase (alpha-D-glucose-1,6-bisphosphate-dependent) n=1 Tax=Desulfopila aestuarii DSM 18488 TaxID=1121416 RepID=A0A1M7Y288_9BACT|nr:phosphoglucomutase [Desulfopila aestuarii]SHO45983.1 phosphomannomutase [Desulfopila aestuarii DSM 18488]
MAMNDEIQALFSQYIIAGDHAASDYFPLVKELVKKKNESGESRWQKAIDTVYDLVEDEIRTNVRPPTETVKFGTSGWRGQLGKDIFVRSVACVTAAIVEMYATADDSLFRLLGVASCDEAKKRGCVVGHDNRFAGHLLTTVVCKVLSDAGFTVYYAGESTTGVLSAAVLELGAAFSVNLTPSHNPLEYGGYKFNAADAGPAAEEVTGTITRLAREIVDSNYNFDYSSIAGVEPETFSGVTVFDSLATWQSLVRKNRAVHNLDLDAIMASFADSNDMVVVVDSVHGASRLHMPKLLPEIDRCILLRNTADVTFGGIAPEPSSVNMKKVQEVLAARKEKLKLGAIIDPDGDRIRFSDGACEISMNQFGAMAYHFLVVYKKKKGMVAKTVATSNMANCLARAFGEELFEPKVGFKEFKPVIGRALVIFEESDGISIIGHTPEKDAYIGLLLALDMVITTGMSLGRYRDMIEKEYGAYYPDRDGITVSVKGPELLAKLNELEKYGVDSQLMVGSEQKTIKEVITIDGRKMIFEDGSWLMVRPSGTEPKVRFYVESRTESGTNDLVATARGLLQQIGLV